MDILPVKIDNSMLSLSIIPILPTPAEERFAITVEPSPPDPAINTLEDKRASVPFLQYCLLKYFCYNVHY